MIDIKDISGKVLKSVLETSDCRINEELMSLCFISLSWDDDNDMTLPEGSYIERNGEKYQLLEPYNPSFISENAFRYTPVFYDRIALWSKKPCFLVTDSGEETDWSMTAYPGQFMDVIIRALSKYVGETYTYSVDASIAQSTMEYIAFQNKSIFDALTDIANAWESEWWVEGTVIHLSKCQYGDPVVLSVGESTGVPSVTNNKDGYFTRFYAFGSTKNITQDYNDGGFTNGLVNKRLTLNPDKYPGGYIDIRPDLKNDEVFVKTLTFDNIFPSSNLEIVDVRAELREYLDSDGNKIQIGESADGDPLYKQYAIWYFKISDFEFNNSTYDKDENPEGMLLPGLDLSVIFESGQLNGRDFKLTYHADTKEYEIHFIEESGSIIIPGTVSSIPANGDKIVLYNIRMPQEYTLSAQDDLEEALLSEMAKYAKDLNTYTVPSNPVYFNANGLDLNVGQSVTFMFGSRMLSTRVLKVEKRLDYPIEQTITIGEKKIKGNTQEIKEEVIDANQNIDVVKALADLNKAITDGYGRVQQLIIQSMSQYKGMWVLNQNGHPDDPSYWTVETDFQAISRKSLVAYGDVICMASEPAIDSAELPIAGYGVSNFGLTALKQGGGLLIDADNLIYVDPSFAGGGGGLNKEELEKYLKDNKYYNYQTALDGYVLPEKYTPITAQDTILSAFGKLERNFDNYVTIATDQTITGSKRFKKTVISEDDVICMASDPAIPSSELPIATKTAIGMIKVGPTLTISEDGQLDTAGESITGVHWDDIMGKPSTYPPSSHTHTVSQISNFPTYWDWNYIDNKPSTFTPSYHTHTISQITNIDQANVSTAKKLAQYVYLWGNLFNGASDVSGDLSGVGDITPSSNGSYNLGSSGYRFARLYLTGNNGNWILGKTDGAITIDSANSSTSTYFPLLRMKAYTGRVFNIGLFQGNDLGHQFGFFMYDPDRTSNGTDAEFYMNSYGNMRGSGSLIMTGDVMCMSSSPEISSSELPVATSNTLGLIKVGSTLKISNGVLDVANTGSGGGSDVRFGLYDDNYVTLHVDNSYYELSRRRHKHSVTTSGSGNAVTSISFGTDGSMTQTKGSTFSLSGHTHSQYLTSHQTIYSLTIKQNGTTLGTYTPNSGSKTINITMSSGGTWSGGPITQKITSNGLGTIFQFYYGGYDCWFVHGGALTISLTNSGSSSWSKGFSFNSSGNATANGGSWQSNSDMRRKTRLRSLDLDIRKLVGVDTFYYYMKDDSDKKEQLGVSAQEMLTIIPTLVDSYKSDLDGINYYTFDYGKCGALLAIKTIQDFIPFKDKTKSEIDLLKQRIMLLEAENLNLWNALNKEAA